VNTKQLLQDPGHFSQGIFAALPESEWKSTADLPNATHVERKAQIFQDGDPASDVYLVGSGLIKTYKSPAPDRVQITNILGEGDVLGAEALSRDTYQESATALTRAVVYRINEHRFHDLMLSHPDVAITLIRMLNQEFDRIQTQMCDLGTKKALSRVASCLLLFKDKQLPDGRAEPFNLPISRQEMGAFLGLSPETVSRQLKILTDSRMIRLEHKRLTILDGGRLRSIAEG